MRLRRRFVCGGGLDVVSAVEGGPASDPSKLELQVARRSERYRRRIGAGPPDSGIGCVSQGGEPRLLCGVKFQRVLLQSTGGPRARASATCIATLVARSRPERRPGTCGPRESQTCCRRKWHTRRREQGITARRVREPLLQQLPQAGAGCLMKVGCRFLVLAFILPPRAGIV